MAIGTLAELKTFLGVTGTDDDTLLTRLWGAAQARLERLTGRTFEAASFTETLSGLDSPSMFVKNPPINTLTSVATLASDGTSTTVDSDDYRFESLTGEIRLLNSVPSRTDSEWSGDVGFSDFITERPAFRGEFRNVVVVYNGGYSTVPEDLEQAVYEIAGLLYRDSKRDTSVQSESLGDYSYSLPSGSGAAEREAKIRSIASNWIARWLPL